MVGGKIREALPADAHAAAGFTDGVDGVANQVDEELLELIAVALDRDSGTRHDLDMVRLLQRSDAIDERADVERRQLRRWQFREARVALMNRLSDSDRMR